MMTLEEIVFILAIFLLANYVIGRIVNRLRINKILRSYKPILSKLDRNVSSEVRASKIVIFKGRKLSKKIGRYSLGIFLIGLENIFTWLIARLSGRKEMVILKSRVKNRSVILDIVNPKLYPGRIPKGSLSYRGYIIIKNRNIDPKKVERVIDLLKDIRPLIAFSLRNSTPELVVTFSYNDLDIGDIDKYIGKIDDALSLIASFSHDL